MSLQKLRGGTAGGGGVSYSTNYQSLIKTNMLFLPGLYPSNFQLLLFHGHGPIIRDFIERIIEEAKTDHTQLVIKAIFARKKFRTDVYCQINIIIFIT